MKKSSLQKSNWEDNQWLSVEIDPYEAIDFLIVLTSICTSFSIAMPAVIDTLEGYAADLVIQGSPVTLLMDQWTFSVATPNETLRDQIFVVLEKIAL